MPFVLLSRGVSPQKLADALPNDDGDEEPEGGTTSSTDEESSNRSEDAAPGDRAARARSNQRDRVRQRKGISLDVGKAMLAKWTPENIRARLGKGGIARRTISQYAFYEENFFKLFFEEHGLTGIDAIIAFDASSGMRHTRFP